MELQVAKTLARSLMDEHGLEDWTFEFDRSVRRFGACFPVSIKKITLSRELTLLNGEERVRDVILHEIAHAIHALRGRKKGCRSHGREWKKIAISIGCNGERCYDDTVNTPKHKMVGECPTCGYRIYRYRLRSKSLACARCCKGIWNEKHIFQWKAM